MEGGEAGELGSPPVLSAPGSGGSAAAMSESVPIPRSRTTWALAFVFLSLLALVVVPILVERRIDDLREDVEDVAEPARQWLREAKLAAAWEASSMRGFLLSGDRRFLELYQNARVDEQHAFQQLHPLVRRLGPAPLEAFVEIRELGEARRAGKDAVFRGDVAPQEYAKALASEQSLHLRFLEAARLLEGQFDAVVADRRARVQTLERYGLIATTALVVLAFAAALVVAWLARRQYQLARELERRAREEEALRRAAHDLTEPIAVQEVLRRITESATARDGADGAFVEQIHPGTDEVEVTSVAGRGTLGLATRLPYPGSLAAKALDTGEPELIRDLGRDGRPSARRILESCGDCSVLVIPLRAGGPVLGAMVLLRAPERRPFSAEEIERARTLGDLASLALRRVLLLRETEHQRVIAERLSEELRYQMESKSRFMRGVGHDVKNPLGAVLGYADVMLQGIYGDLTPKQAHGIERMRVSVESALALIEDLLDLARAQEGRLEIAPVLVDLALLAHDSAEEHRAAAVAKGQALEVDPLSDLPRVTTDPQRVRQILGNLLSNAIKYTPEGGSVRVHAEVVEGRRAGDPDRWVALQVSDTGPGIPEDKQELIFDEFSRLDPEIARGAGLGLAISQRIAHLLGGEITVTSEVGRGSTFALRLPLRKASDSVRDVEET